MPDLDVDNFYESDSSDNEEKHTKLLNSVSQLDSTQRVKPASRKEVTSEVSEYNLTQAGGKGKNLVNVKELAQVLGNKSSHVSIAKKFSKVTQNSSTLPKPLEKPVEDRVKRSVGFDNVKKQLRKWDAVVTRNALKDHISFPLNDNSMKMQKSHEFLHQYKTQTPLEEEMAKVLKQEKKLENGDDDEEFPLTLEEMLEKRKEMAQLRAKLSYREAKAQRQSKIKSKKYHRILKHEKLKQQLKEFELLQKTDPEAALQKLSELDKTRAQERASLRHRNTGQWAKNLTVKAKYDVESRKVLAEQLKMSRELTQKVHNLDSSDEDEETEPITVPNLLPENNSTSSKENPWTLDVSKEVEDFVSGYKKYWSEKNNENIQDKPNESESNKLDAERSKNTQVQNSKGDEITSESKKMPEISQNGSSPSGKSVSSRKRKKKSFVDIQPVSGVWIVTPIPDETSPEIKKKKKEDDIDALFEDLDVAISKKVSKKVKNIKSKLKKEEKRKKKSENKDSNQEFDLSLKNKSGVERPDVDIELLEGGEEADQKMEQSSANPIAIKSRSEPEIDPKNFIKVRPKRLNTHIPENVTGGEDAVDDEEVQQMAIKEAFGDDDVIAEFREMKEEEEKKNKLEVESSLPGWGEWGGQGIVSKRKKKLPLILNLPKRKDVKKIDMIINENENPKLRDHLVKDVPHPFTSVEAFEANIRAPVGRDWVPETAHRKLIEKQVVTKLGAIIEPMDENEIVRLKKASKSPYQGKKKNKNAK